VDLQLGFPGSWTRLVPQALSEVLVWWQKATRSPTANEGGDSTVVSEKDDQMPETMTNHRNLPNSHLLNHFSTLAHDTTYYFNIALYLKP